MKTILLTIALAGFTGLSAFAQNKNCCCAKQTAMRHKVHHHWLASKTIVKPVMPMQEEEPCFTYRKHNIVVTECPSTLYSDDGLGFIGVNRESDYLGYFPDNNVTPPATESMAPLSNQLMVTSSAFTNNGVIPAKYTCEGDHASPPLSIGNIPAGAKSLAVVMYDPHATANESMTYWLVWDIDTTGNIPENFISDNQSINAAKEWGYQAICPVSGTHNYHFMVYALDTKIIAGRHTTKATLERAMKGHVLAKGEIVGIYNKHLD